MVSAPVLLGDYLIKQRWLSSGFVHTAEFNCLKMAQIVAVLVYMHNQMHGQNDMGMTTEEVEIIESFPFWREKMMAGKTLLDLARDNTLDPIFGHFGVTMK